jgi:regulator of protease activity HflC (stomatin/prohibitin superfamily)
MRSTIVPQHSIGLLYEDGGFVRQLAPGRHRFPRTLLRRVLRRVVFVDTRERSLTIKGQEILTGDKVAVRISLLVYFRVTDVEAAVHGVESYEERIYEDVQLAARRYLANRTLEAILQDRNEISDAVRQDVSDAAAGYGVQIVRADVKDLVFPGNLREIMNQVLETERLAEAQLIQARKDAEAAEIRADAERLAAEREAEAQRLRQEQQLASELAVAQELAAHPELLKVRQLTVLRELARTSAGKFVIGVPGDELLASLKL